MKYNYRKPTAPAGKTDDERFQRGFAKRQLQEEMNARPLRGINQLVFKKTKEEKLQAKEVKKAWEKKIKKELQGS